MTLNEIAIQVERSARAQLKQRRRVLAIGRIKKGVVEYVYTANVDAKQKVASKGAELKKV